jgi:hypothetical protein
MFDLVVHSTTQISELAAAIGQCFVAFNLKHRMTRFRPKIHKALCTAPRTLEAASGQRQSARWPLPE